MKKSFYLTALVLTLTLTVACEEENDPVIPKIEQNGLTREINDLVPQSILDEMERLGMPINRGAKPPLVEGRFFVSPLILLSSNRPGDVPGYRFADYITTFFGQDNDELTIMLDYENGDESGSGLGSFIVGEGRKFSVFVAINAVQSGGTPAKLVNVFSGYLANGGIEDLYVANFMIDDNGDPQNVWIENGEGRVAYDQDGFSERL